MSPTILRRGDLRFFFFSREETRMHVHVQSPDGEAKFWLEPTVALAQNHGLKARAVFESLRLIQEHEQEFRKAWYEHFGR
jgi:hypothetical protein